jgi:ADP-heptose:LPS heptosyltransferase
VIPVDPRGSRKQLAAAFRSIWRRRYDVAIDLQGLIKSAVLSRAAVPRRVVGFVGAHLREPWARMLYSETVDPGERRHVIDKNLALMRAVGVGDTQVAFPLSIPQTDAVDIVDGRHPAGRFVLLNPGAAWPNKRWPPARFGTLAAAIRGRLGLPSIVLWGPSEQPLAAAVVAASDGAASLAPRTAILDLPGITRRAALMVSGDTGPLHIAAAVGTPIVALFGPSDPGRNGPWSPLDVTLSRYSRCTCQYERRCRQDTPCIEAIPVDEVVAAVDRRIGVRG